MPLSPLIAMLVVLLVFLHDARVRHTPRFGRACRSTLFIRIFSYIGCVIYSLLESLPYRRPARSRQPKPAGTAALRRRVQERDPLSSVDKRMALARECTEHGLHDEAISLYRSCLQGSFTTDGMLLFYLAQALVAGRQWHEADKALRQLRQHAPRMRPREAALLEARSLQGLGRHDDALAAYHAVTAGSGDLEARYRCARLLQARGRQAEAERLFAEILALAARTPTLSVKDRRWLAATRGAHGADRIGHQRIDLAPPGAA